MPNRLKLVTIGIYDHQIQALFNSVAVLSLLSTDIVNRIEIELKESVKKIVVANGETSRTVGSVTALFVSFDKAQISTDFLVIDNPPFNTIIGLPALESFQACIDLEMKTVTKT